MPGLRQWNKGFLALRTRHFMQKQPLLDQWFKQHFFCDPIAMEVAKTSLIQKLLDKAGDGDLVSQSLQKENQQESGSKTHFAGLMKGIIAKSCSTQSGEHQRKPSQAEEIANILILAQPKLVLYSGNPILSQVTSSRESCPRLLSPICLCRLPQPMSRDCSALLETLSPKKGTVSILKSCYFAIKICHW